MLARNVFGIVKKNWFNCSELKSLAEVSTGELRVMPILPKFLKRVFPSWLGSSNCVENNLWAFRIIA